MLRLDLRKELEATREALLPETELSADDQLSSELLQEFKIDTYSMGQRRLEQRKRLLQTAYTEEQIRNICIHYRLRCLPVALFKGQLDELVPQKKKEFELYFKEAMQEELQEQEYRLLAPSEMFQLATVDRDPLLLYRFVHKGTYYYHLVHQWGGDLSKWRAIVNYPLRSVKHLISCSLLIWSVIVIAFAASLGISLSSHVPVTAIILSALTIFSVSIFKSESGNYQTSDTTWDSEYEW